MVAFRDELIDRIELTAQQVGVVGFTLNRHGYSSVKNIIDPWKMTCFGVRFWIVDEQKQRALAFWNLEVLGEYLQKHEHRDAPQPLREEGRSIRVAPKAS
jgi:hypothetical protein